MGVGQRLALSALSALSHETAGALQTLLCKESCELSINVWLPFNEERGSPWDLGSLGAWEPRANSAIDGLQVGGEVVCLGALIIFC